MRLNVSDFAPRLAIAVGFLLVSGSLSIGADAPVPGKSWSLRTPAEAGLDPARLDAFAKFVGGRGCVVRGGTMVYTWGDPTRAGDVASAAKPVYGHFLLEAVATGKLKSYDEPVVAFEPRLKPLNADLGNKDREIQWRHLINQTSCYGVTERPGEAFDYNDFNLALLFDTLFLKLLGASYDTVDRDVLRPGLADPLQFEDRPTFLAFGPEDRPGRLAISPRDFARFGLLYLRNGRWGDRQLVPADLVRTVTQSPLPNTIPRTQGKDAEMIQGQRSIGGGKNQTDHLGSYSFAWWTNGVDREGKRHWPNAPVNTWGAFGHNGKRALVVFPGLDLIVSWNDTRIDGRDDENRALGLLLAALVTPQSNPNAQAGEPDASPGLIVRNAKVITVDPGFRIAQAVAIRGDRILAVGSDAEITRLAGPSTRTLDAGGKTVMPGLYDSHVHPLGAATSEADHPIPSFRSLEDIKVYFQERAKTQPKGTWIVARYAFPTRLDESRFPTRAELDAIAPDHPVLHQAGPAGMVNSKALEISGITKDTPNPPVGQVVKDPKTGEPTGMIRNAYSVLKGLPGNAYADDGVPDTERIKTLFKLYNSRGLTSVADRSASDQALRVYRALRDRGELNLRVNATRVLSPPFGDRAEIARKLNALAGYDTTGEPNGPTGVGDHWVRIGPLKLFLDGGMLNGTAYMREPWGVGPTYQITEPDYRGLLFVEPETLGTIAEEVARRGWQMTAHVAGEASMDELLKAYGKADRAIGIQGRRWLITHANFTSAENLERCARLGVGADLQPAWLFKDSRTLLKVLGPDRMRWFHPYRKWLDAGLLIGGGSDHMIRLDPIEATNPWDPWLGLWVAVTRQTEGAGVLNPDQKMTREEAIRFYTINNAKLHFEELQKGSIEPGKLADLILVDRDPLTCPEDDLKSTQVLWTMVGGRFVHGNP